jgi:hypothetical protein
MAHAMAPVSLSSNQGFGGRPLVTIPRRRKNEVTPSAALAYDRIKKYVTLG